MYRQAGLTRKLLSLLMAVLVLMSLVFLFLFWMTYQAQLRGERSEASIAVNQLLQASLENAMLKRDIPGLRGIVSRLSEQPEIRDVVILNPRGEVRFSGTERIIGLPYETPLSEVCPSCASNMRTAQPSTRFVNDKNGNRVLRSVNPVKNHPPCSQCHGNPRDNPVNGILVVDYRADKIIRKARSGLAGLVAAGLIITSLTSWMVWRFMRRQVLEPVSLLNLASREIAQGNFDQRVQIDRQDEFGELATNFNRMADRLNTSLQQLLEKEDYLQALVDAIPDGLRVIDEDFRITLVNTAYRKQLELDDMNPVGSYCYRSSHRRNSPCPHTLYTCPVYELAAHGGTVKTMQQFNLANDRQLDVQIFAAPLEISTNGKTRRFIVESIRDLAADLQFSHEQKLAALGELAAGVAHEINNPLASIRLALQSVLTKLDHESVQPEKVGNYLKLVDGEIDKCISVSQSLLKLTTLNTEKQQLVEINTAIQETVSLLRYEAEKSNVDIALSLADPTPRIIAADHDIRMLVLNLTQNAFHAMPEGGIIRISSTSRQDCVELSFQDNGAGIRPEDKPYIFDPFFSHRANKQYGVGLGLTICQSIVHRYGGEIRVTDVKPHGACFTIIFPTPESS